MNEPTPEPTPETPVAKKRGRPPNPKPQTIPTAEIPNEHAEVFAENLGESNLTELVVTAEARPRIGDLYAALDAAPVEWLPSLLARMVKRSLKSGAWTSVENLILSVNGFAKK